MAISANSARRIVGILGGTFDPVHQGHVLSANELTERLPFDELRLLPASVPPHRAQPVASPPQRLAMLKLAIEDYPALKVDVRELKRSGPSYTIDTLKNMRRSLSERTALILIMGADAFTGLPSWKDWQMLTDYAHILVMARAGGEGQMTEPLWQWLQTRQVNEAGALCDQPAGKVAFLQLNPQPYSATVIRHALSRGEKPQGLIPSVYNYIVSNHLYSDADSSSMQQNKTVN
jgi:nicotinate-nucleotide adenylyltransferase